MSIIKFTPEHNLLADFANMQKRFNELFSDFISPADAWKGNSDVWNPSVDIVDRKEDVLVKAELPGVRKDDVKITLQENILTIKGEKKMENESKEDGFHRIERSYGHFVRSFTLPMGVKSDGIQADYKDGILTIKLPKINKDRQT